MLMRRILLLLPTKLEFMDNKKAIALVDTRAKRESVLPTSAILNSHFSTRRLCVRKISDQSDQLRFSAPSIKRRGKLQKNR